MQRIFERFERGRRSDQTRGFGLGLWVARRVAQLHDGDVRVDSTPGQGHLPHAGVAAAARRQRQLRWWHGESRIIPRLLLLPLQPSMSATAVHADPIRKYLETARTQIAQGALREAAQTLNQAQLLI